MWEQIRANQKWSVALAIGMAALLLVVGYAAGTLLAGDGWPGVFIALVVWGVMLLVAAYSGDSILLSLSRAREVKREDAPQLWNVVEEMKIASGLPAMPRVFIIDDPAPNAFATGRSPDRAAIAVTTGLLQSLNRDELQGVVAHEIGHVANRDVKLMLYAAVMLGAIVLLADVTMRSLFWGGGRRRSRSDSGGGQAAVILMVVAIVMMILAPLFARLIYFAVSRRREYLADASSARFTRYPEGLASALEKIAASPEKLQVANRATAPMYIVNPLQRVGRKAADLTSTHPPISERIRILRSMAGASYADYDAAQRQVTGRKAVLPPSARTQAESLGLRGPTQAAAPGEAAAGEPVPPDTAARARQVGDLMWKLQNYAFVDCACGATLKIPPGLTTAQITCPACGREHPVPPPATPGKP